MISFSGEFIESKLCLSKNNSFSMKNSKDLHTYQKMTIIQALHFLVG